MNTSHCPSKHTQFVFSPMGDASSLSPPTSKCILSAAPCLNHHHHVSFAAFSAACATIRGSRVSTAWHLSSSKNTIGRACTPHSRGSYAKHMFSIYATVTARGLQHFLGAKYQLPSKFKFDECVHLVYTDAERETHSFILNIWCPSQLSRPCPHPF